MCFQHSQAFEVSSLPEQLSLTALDKLYARAAWGLWYGAFSWGDVTELTREPRHLYRPEHVQLYSHSEGEFFVNFSHSYLVKKASKQIQTRNRIDFLVGVRSVLKRTLLRGIVLWLTTSNDQRNNKVDTHHSKLNYSSHRAGDSSGLVETETQSLVQSVTHKYIWITRQITH